MNGNEMKSWAYLEKITDVMLAQYKTINAPGQKLTAYQEAINLSKRYLIEDIVHASGLIIARDIYGNYTLIPEDGLDV